MPVLSSFRLIREGEVWGGLPARDSRKTGVVALGDSCFIPHEAREGRGWTGTATGRQHPPPFRSAPAPPTPPMDLLFAIEIIFPSISGHSRPGTSMLVAFAKIILTNRLSSATVPS